MEELNLTKHICIYIYIYSGLKRCLVSLDLDKSTQF